MHSLLPPSPTRSRKLHSISSPSISFTPPLVFVYLSGDLKARYLTVITEGARSFLSESA